MIIKACVLYVISLTGAGFVTEDCYADQAKVELYNPHSVYIVNETNKLPRGGIYYEAEHSYVEYWTWPSVRMIYTSYPSYRISFGYPLGERRVINKRRVVRQPARTVTRRHGRTVSRGPVRIITRRPVRKSTSRTLRSPRHRAKQRVARTQPTTAHRSSRRPLSRTKPTARPTKRRSQRKRNVSRRSRRSR